MAQTIISVRVDKGMHEQMKEHEEINWSGVLRRTIAHMLGMAMRFDREKAFLALERAKSIGKETSWNMKKSSTELIREWRDKRK